MGRNAASVFPAAVAAEMMRSPLPSSTMGIAASWASRSVVHPLRQIHRCTFSCSIVIDSDGGGDAAPGGLFDSEPEGGEIVMVARWRLRHGRRRRRGG